MERFDSTMDVIPARPIAFDSPPPTRLGKIVVLVALAHVIVIIGLLTYVNLPLDLSDADNLGQGQSGLIIPVTLEARDPIAPEKTTDETSETTEEEEIPTESVETPEISVDIPAVPAPPTPAPRLTPAPPLSTPSPAQPSVGFTQGAASTPSDKSAGTVPNITAAQVDPNYLHRPNPIYPTLSQRRQEQGAVQLLVSLDAQGAVREINVHQSSGYARLDQAALDAVRQWRFLPAKRGDISVAATVMVPVEFKHSNF